MADSACTATPGSRAFAEWFETHRISEKEALRHLDDVPLSRVYLVADEARGQAALWERVATGLEARAAAAKRR